jgi:hypothetical protein
MASDELRTVLSPLLSLEERAIWITENSYIRLVGDRSVEDRHEKQFFFSLTDTNEHYNNLSIHASTLEEAIICLDYLVGLKDTHFEEMWLSHKDASPLRLCPFGAKILEKILQNSTRRVSFNFMIFTADHCRTLATSGTKTDMQFYSCQFQDEGAAFVEASAARQDVTSGPAKLRFVNSNPFNDRNWALLLNQLKLALLGLWRIKLSEVKCRAMATAEVRCLTLEHCNLEDGGAALVESVRQGRGPKELSFDGDPFGSSESFVTFMNLLRGDEHLERLELPHIDLQETRALAAALHENKGLLHLTVQFLSLRNSGPTELLDAISLHPSLRSLDLKIDTTMLQIDPKKRREVTKAVADMLSVNERVEEMRFDIGMFDIDDWNTHVSPKLECNKYRKLFPSIQTIEEASTRASVLVRALAKFASKPHLVWMLLNQNHDILSSYLDTAHDRNSILSRKRSRSPSLDAASTSN